VVLGAGLTFPAAAQNRASVERERTEFAEWLRTSPVSPWRALVVRPIGGGLTLGPESADIPLAGIPSGRLTERDGRVLLRTGGGEIGLSRGRVQTVETWRLIVSGPPGRAAVTIFRPEPSKQHKKPTHYAHDPKSVHVVTLRPATEPRTQRLLARDGVEVEATDAGTVKVSLGAAPTPLRVMRLPGATEDESELEVFFRDGTSGKTTYPAGRFVSLIPRSDGRYLLDFNRARNPFCAYNTVYPCPAPWRGNALSVAVRAGERYAGGGLGVPIP
jgi:uncharacterized protein (DUF1684 family)